MKAGGRPRLRGRPPCWMPPW